MYTFVGTDQVKLFQAAVLKRGLILYNDTGLKPNTSWTPTAMLKTASGITGKTYKRGDYMKAARDLEDWLVERSNA